MASSSNGLKFGLCTLPLQPVAGKSNKDTKEMPDDRKYVVTSECVIDETAPVAMYILKSTYEVNTTAPHGT